MAEDISRILVPVDFSPHAERAFRYAVTLAHRLGAQLALVHVVEDPFVTGAWSGEVFVPNIPELLQSLIAGAEPRLASLRDQAVKAGVPTDAAVITGRPAQAIVEHAATTGCDLLVMGTHGRTGLAHAVMGSVAERVLRKASCPVLTLRADAAAADTTQPA